MKEPIQAITYHQVSSAGWEAKHGAAVVEAPVSLTVNGIVWITFMCTPVDQEALALGFLANEGLIHSMAEVADVRVCPEGDNVDVWLHHKADQPKQWRRTSGCTGGHTSVEIGDVEPLSGLEPGKDFRMEPGQVSRLVTQLFEAQDIYRQSGGIHTAALSDGERVHISAEDIGRHNTLDKITGKYLLTGIKLERRIILTTGRISSEMMQKAARLGAGVVISRTAASSMAIELAQRWGITLIGYARRDRFNVYSAPERIKNSIFEG